MRAVFHVIFLGMVYQISSWCLRTTLQQNFQIEQVDWASDNSIFVSANKAEKIIRIYDAKTYELLRIYDHLGVQPKSIKISKDSKYIAVGYKNSDLKLFHAVPPFNSFFQKATGQSDIAQVDFDYQNTKVMSCGDDKGYVSYSLTSQTIVDDVKFVPNPGNALACRYGPLGHIAYSDINNRVRMHDSSKTQVFFDILPAITFQMDFKPASSTVATANRDNKVRFNLSIIITDSSDVRTVSMGKMGKNYAIGGSSKILRIYNQSSNQQIAKFGNFGSDINSIKISSDQNFMIVADKLGQIKVYSTTCNFNCESGEFEDLGVCKKCYQTMPFCMSCKTGASCDICMTGYYKSGTLCVSCSSSLQNCISCSDIGACLNCLDNYYLDSGKCKKCSQVMPGCLACNSSGICKECFMLDYHLDSTLNKCKKCTQTLVNCVRCFNSTICVDCKIGFYQHPTTKNCVQCPLNCLNCQSSANCTQCKVGYWASGGNCVRCTATGCLSCNQTGICYECQDGTFMTGTNSCSNCNTPCVTCSALSTNCTSCVIGNYLDSSAFMCLKCIQNCNLCNQSSKCLRCYSGFNVDSTSFTCKPCSKYYGNCSQCSSTQCLKCSQGFYIDSASYMCKTCVSVMSNCLNCNNYTSCVQCVTSYYHTGSLGNGSCYACPAGCQQCISPNNCTNCFTTYFKNSSLVCSPCQNKCFQCSSDTSCDSCVVGYYLDAVTCKPCQSALMYCAYCLDVNTCVNCVPGSYLDTDKKCKLCTSSCTTCNITDCISCQIGYYLSGTPTKCTICPTFCQQCTSSMICTSCSQGYYFDSVDDSCKSCSQKFSRCTLCTKTNCLQCQRGTQLNISDNNACTPCLKHIANCKVCYWDNTVPTPNVKCSLCSYGFGVSSDLLACPQCNQLTGCIQCTTSSKCTKCEIGYFLKPDNTCRLCSSKCLTCDNSLTCLTCTQGYVYDLATLNCVLCQSKLNGCSKCIPDGTTDFNCTYCQVGYFLQPSESECHICHQQIIGCYTCNNSITCTSCLDKYYLQTSNNECKKCATNLAGCQLCSSSSVCISCSDTYYLKSDNKCYFCSQNIAGCLQCKNNSICSLCNAGYYITPGKICNLCQAIIQGCLYCSNSLTCIQCRAGYYLDSGDKKCHKCQQPGCGICSFDTPSSCVNCLSKYYLSGTTCLTCRTRVPYCQQCDLTSCLSCDVGYYLASSSSCLKCSSTMNGCSRCKDSSTCLECMSSYFVNSSNVCQQCNLVLFGCQNCIDSTSCLSCSTNFFLNSTTLNCQSCTNIQGCLLCRNEQTCVLCQGKYYMDVSTHHCHLCSTAIQGCFSCISNAVCVQCQSGYILDPTIYTCVVNTIQAKQRVKSLKLVTFYVNEKTLKHTLYSKGMNFRKVDISQLNIIQNDKTKLLIEDFTGKQIQLNIRSYEYGAKGNSIVFLTDNPLNQQIQGKSNIMPFRRRLLNQIDGGMQINLEVLLKMDDDVYKEILPQLDFKGAMTVGYSLNNPQFVNSFMRSQQKNFFGYQVFGIVIIAAFLVNLVLKSLRTVPQQKNKSGILPHIIALKSCCLIMYPAHFEYINFCQGFMIVDIPWANPILTQMLTDQSDHVQVPFGLFYGNMSIAGTFFVGFSVYVFLCLLGYAYFSVNQEKIMQKQQTQKSSQLSSQEQRRNNIFRIQNIEEAIGVNYDNDQSSDNKTYLLKKNFLQLLWNIFVFSIVYYSCLSVQGAFFNPSQIISTNGVFYILGMLLFIYITIQTFYSFIRNSKTINKVRVFFKGCLLSLAHFNPIYIVSVCAILDVTLTFFQFYLLNKKNQFTKLFILTHVLSMVSIILMVFVSQSLGSLILTVIFLVFSFGVQVYVHVKQYQIINGTLSQQQFNFEENQPESQEGGSKNNFKTNVWDIGMKTLSPSNQMESFRGPQMFADVKEISKQTLQNKFVMDDTQVIPSPMINYSEIDSKNTPRQRGRRNKFQKNPIAINTNKIKVTQNPFERNKENDEDNKFTLQDLQFQTA